MYTTLDTYVSKLYGVDNELCAPNKSISFWSLMVVAIFDLLEIQRHYSHARSGLTLALTVLVLSSSIILYAAKTKVHNLSKLDGSAHALVQLRLLSRLINMLAGAALTTSFAALYFLS